MGLDPSVNVSEIAEVDGLINLEPFNFNDMHSNMPPQARKPSKAESTNSQNTPSDPMESPNVTSINSINSPESDGSPPDPFFMQELCVGQSYSLYITDHRFSHEVYFSRAHSAVPILHKIRYLNSFYKPPAQQPPMYLRYIVWALAAHMSDSHKSRAAEFYSRARRYVQEDELNASL